MQVELDPSAGFCFGVNASIAMAEDYLQQGNRLFCLGELVHNEEETKRLVQLGMRVITHDQFSQMEDETVLIRAHGEPPSTYAIAQKNRLKIIDGTCPIVEKLQRRVSCSFDDLSGEGGQVVVFGSKNHPEVIGLAGQTGNKAIIITSMDELTSVDFTRKIHLYSQTTRNEKDYLEVQNEISRRIKEFGGNPEQLLKVVHSICKQVSRRVPMLQEFAAQQDVMVFVAGKSSSNGKVLFESSRSVNPNSYFVSDTPEIKKSWFNGVERVGVSGATSTPKWLLEDVADCIRNF